MCAVEPHNGRYTVRVTDGELPVGTIGLLATKGVKLNPGDCFGARIQLSVADVFSRFAFKGTILQINTSIRPQPNNALLNSMRKFMSNLQGDSRNLVAGLAIGIDDGLSENFKQNMKTTGLTHLTAVSGANCAIVLGLIWLLLRKLGLGRGTRTTIALVALTGYVLLVGGQPSVLRSAFMMSVVFIALELGRKVWLPGALLLGSFVLLVVDPWMLFEYGFWLSVLATFGLVTLSPVLAEKLSNYTPKWLALALAATVAAQIWCLPLLVQLQGGITTHSILANLLAEPMVPLVTVLGILATGIGGAVPFLGQLLLTLASYPASWIVFVANSLAMAPIHLIPIGSEPIPIILVTLFVVSISIALLRKKFLAFLIAGILATLWGITNLGLAVSNSTWANFAWQVVACDVGQGDALVIRSGSNVAVIDVGRDDQPIDDCLDTLKVNDIDLLVLTHFDQDHVGAIDGLLRGRSVHEVLLSTFTDPRPKAHALVKQVQRVIPEVIFAPEHLTGSLGEFTWEVISSEGDLGNTANEASLGIRFESEQLIVYTLADLNELAQDRIVGQIVPNAKPTVVKVSHHGSSDQSENFYQKISADVALISVGAKNSYGHPTSKTLDFLTRQGTRIFRTDQNGSIALRVANGSITVKPSHASVG